MSPDSEATGVAVDSAVAVSFSEAVELDAGWFDLDCEASGVHAGAVTGGPASYTITPAEPFAPGERCAAAVSAAAVHDRDADDPPDTPAADFAWRFRVADVPPADGVVINELDSDTPGSDTAEFVELYDGGRGEIDLSGLVVVFWNGGNDSAYRAFDLDGRRTDGEGYFVLGNAAVAAADLVFGNAGLQNGPDAVSLHAGNAADFPGGAAITTAGLRDAVVYGPAGTSAPGLWPLLEAGQDPVDEGARGAADRDALQRCPNGQGPPRHTTPFRPGAPSPGTANACAADAAPTVAAVSPPDGGLDVPPAAALVVEFSEPVAVDRRWYRIACARSGSHTAAVAGGPSAYTLTPVDPFASGEACTVTLLAAKIHDADADDPPDGLPGDFTWSFATLEEPPADAAPAVAAVWPAPATAAVPLTATLHITFSEAVALDDGWFALTCGAAGAQAVQTTLEGAVAAIAPRRPLPPGSGCAASVQAALVHDRDSDDPPDTLPGDYTWQFQTAAATPPAAAFSSNSPVWIGEAVVFTNASHGPGPLAFAWDFGDGTTSTAVHPIHRYLRPGTYTVTLAASGTSSATAAGEVVVRHRAVYLPLLSR